MAKSNALEQYKSKIAEAQEIARSASEDLRSRAKELVKELQSIGTAYEELMGEPMPELAGGTLRTPRGRRANAGSRKPRRSSGGKGKGRRSALKGAYAGLTIPEAVVAAIGKSKSGLGPSEIAEKIGGNRSSIAVAMSGMVKDGLIKRAERGKYTVG